MISGPKDKVVQSLALLFLFLTPLSFLLGPYLFPIPFLLFFLTLSFQEQDWIISQRWEEVVFLHYSVDVDELQKMVPFKLDLYQGKAVLSIVPFVMKKIRFPFLPPVPGLSQLLELNLRTYVIVNGRPAVYFFTLDSNHLPGVLIARWFFALPYRWMKLRFSFDEHYEFKSPQFYLKARVGEERLSNEFDRWSTERYALLTKRGKITLVGTVEHPPWKLHNLIVDELSDNFSSLIGEHLKMKRLMGAAYSHSMDVRFRPFKKV